MPVTNNILWEIDPTSEDATNTPLSLIGSSINGCDMRLHEMDVTPPELEATVASSADTEGDPFVTARYHNRTVSLTIVARGTTDGALQAAMYQIQQKIDKLRREQGTLKFTTQAGSALVGDVNYATFKPEFTPEMYLVNRAVRFQIDFNCRPFFRGGTILQADHVETTLPVLTWTETAIPGDAPALGKLVIDEDQGQNQNWIMWGVENNALYDTSATSAALFYEWEGRTVLGGSGSAAVQTGASGGTVMEVTLDSAYQALASTRATGGGAHLTHVGTFRVFGRFLTPTANAGTVSVALQWAPGDFSTPTTNDATVFPVDSWDNTFRIVDLGLINVEKVAQGTQRWEGRVLAKSTTEGDKLRLDCFWLQPTDKGSGIAEASVLDQVPTSFTGRDSFFSTTAGGALNGRVAPTGGTWVSSGGATDYIFSDDNPLPVGVLPHGEPIKRTTGSADASARFAILGATTTTNVQVQTVLRNEAWFANNGDHLDMGVIARWTDSSNYLRGALVRTQSSGGLIRGMSIDQVVTGVTTNLAVVTGILPSGSTTIWFVLKMRVTADGTVTLVLMDETQATTLGSLTGSSTALATGGALASGKHGLYDINAVTLASTTIRYYDEFTVFVPTVDAALFASQSMEVRNDRVIREDSTGTYWQRPSVYEGDYLLLPPGGKEGRLNRFIVKGSRNIPSDLADTGIDDISARLTVTPRYLVIGQ